MQAFACLSVCMCSFQSTFYADNLRVSVVLSSQKRTVTVSRIRILSRLVIQSVRQSSAQLVSWFSEQLLQRRACTFVLVQCQRCKRFKVALHTEKGQRNFSHSPPGQPAKQTHQRPSDSACAGVRDGDGDNSEDRDRAFDIAAQCQSGNGALTMAVSSRNCFEQAQWFEFEQTPRN